MPVITGSREIAAYLVIGGARVPVQRAEVTKTSKRKADTFSCELSISAATQLAGLDASYWATVDDVECEIIFSIDGAEKSMFTGKLDSAPMDWTKMSVSPAGRDKSVGLTESRRNKKYVNKKASAIVSEIASENGLNPVIVESDDDAGKQYDTDTAHLVLNTTDYEAVSTLAEREGYRWFVDGSDLIFQPKGSSGAVYEVHYTPPAPGQVASANAIRLTTDRNRGSARSTSVKIKSWHHKHKKLYQAEAKASGSGKEVKYEHHLPMLTQGQADKVAKSKLKDAIRHELSVGVEMPADVSIDHTGSLSLSGTGTIFDQEYDIDEVRFSYSWGSAFTMDITGKSALKGRSQ